MLCVLELTVDSPSGWHSSSVYFWVVGTCVQHLASAGAGIALQSGLPSLQSFASCIAAPTPACVSGGDITLCQGASRERFTESWRCIRVAHGWRGM
eukprot:27292-Amphidinium_carterae.1